MSNKNYPGNKSLTITLTDLWYFSGIYLSAVHIPGIVNKTPNGLSRQKLESTEWMLDSSVFCQIVAVYQQPQVDLFASYHNH